MAVAVTTPWRTLPILGPPEVCVAFASAVGDASGGRLSISAAPSDEHFWMVSHVWFFSVQNGSVEVFCRMIATSEFTAANGDLEQWRQQANTEVMVSSGATDFTFRPPPIIWSPQASSNLIVDTVNVDTLIIEMSARAVRWSRDDPIPAFVAYMTSPQR